MTGGVGFIGFHLCNRLAQYHKVIVVDNFNSYYNPKLKEFNADELKRLGVEIVKEDILNYEKLSNIMENIDIVFHLAAQPGIRYSVENPQEIFKINTEGTLKVLEAAKKRNVSLFIFASSSSVYGNCTQFPIKESTGLNPISPYGLSKEIGERYIKYYSTNYKLPTVILRLFSVVGARQRPDMALSKFIFNLLNDKPLPLYGDGTQTRDWINVKNVVDIFLKINEQWESVNITNDVFNIGNGIKTNLNNIIKILEKKIGKQAKIITTEKDPADILHMQADISKINNIFNYKPRYLLGEAIESEIEFINSWSGIKK